MMPPRHPSEMSDHELAALPSTTVIPEWAELAHEYDAGGVHWGVYKNGTIWCRAPLPPEDKLAER